ncbi:MAG: efflux RND transporter periplasmic adaptor subunit [Lachnospiraceae bacterium]|nr:efflux RND transporter periplasmic adaptor subunit [Lachnospiraceae bacterium]
MSILKKKTMAIIGGALAVVVATGSIASIYAKAAVKVNSYTIAKSDMKQVLELNGTVVSNDSDMFFADTNLKVDKVYFKAGEEVKKGDLLVSFDKTEIDNQIALLNLDAESKEGSYQNALQVSDKYSALYSEATRNLNVLNQQIKDTEEAIINKQNEINKRCSDLAYDGAKIQVAIVDNSADPTSDKSKELQKQLYNNAYVQSYDSELVRLQEELGRLNTQLAGFKEYKAEMTSQKASSQLGVLTEGGKAELEAGKAAADFTIEKEIAKLESAKGGIKAECDGVVSAVYAEEGSLLTTGAPVICVDSLEDVIVRCNANKYDIMSIEKGQTVNVKIFNADYTGTVTKTDKMAGMDASAANGVGVDVTLDDANDVILGLDVKARVNTASLTEVVSVPKDAIITEDDKNYVFVSKDKKAIKTSVETGIKNDDYVEITSGLNEGDIVVWSDAKELSDGDEVRF